MKHLLFFLAALFTILGAAAQSPSSFNYQAVLRDADGNIRANETLSITININHEGTTLFTETHNVTTNDFGLVNLVINSVNNDVDFQDIFLNEGPLMLEIIVNGTTMGESELLSVPYALHANKSIYADEAKHADSADEADHAVLADSADEAKHAERADLADEAGNVFSGDYNDLVNTPDLSIYSTTDTTLDESEVSALVHQYLVDNRDYYQTKVVSTSATTNKYLDFQSGEVVLWLSITLPVGGRVDLTGIADVYTNMQSASSKYNIVKVDIYTTAGQIAGYYNVAGTYNFNTDVVVIQQVIAKNSYDYLDAGTYTFYFNFYWSIAGDEANTDVSIRRPYFEARFTPLLPTE